MKKVSSLKKKLAAFSLAVCTFVTSIGMKECAAMNNTPQNQNQQEGWSLGDIAKGTFELAVAAGVLYAAYKLGVLTFIFNQPKTAGNIWLYLSSLIGTGVVLDKIVGFVKKVEALPGKAKKEFEKKAKSVAETVDNVTYIPRKVITAGAKGAVVGAKCAVPVIKYAWKAAFLGAKGLWNLLDWIENG